MAEYSGFAAPKALVFGDSIDQNPELSATLLSEI
jgi:hypothetical protein